LKGCQGLGQFRIFGIESVSQDMTAFGTGKGFREFGADLHAADQADGGARGAAQGRSGAIDGVMIGNRNGAETYFVCQRQNFRW